MTDLTVFDDVRAQDGVVHVVAGVVACVPLAAPWASHAGHAPGTHTYDKEMNSHSLYNHAHTHNPHTHTQPQNTRTADIM